MCTGEGGQPLLNGGGCGAHNLRQGWWLQGVLALPAQARARCSLSIGGKQGGEGGKVVGPSPEFSGFIGVGKEFRIALRITERLDKLRVVVGYEVFRVLMQDGGGQGGA